MPLMINRYFSIYLSPFLRYFNLLRISWQSLPHLYSRILPEGDPEAQGLRAGWGAIFDWLRTQDLGTQLAIIAGMVAVGYITYRFFFSSDGGGPGGGGPGGDDDNDEGGANEPDHQEARRPEEIPLRDNRLDNQNIQPVNIALNNPPAGGLGINEAARYAAAATVGAGLSYMHDRAMNPDNPDANPNQQQQHQPEADVEAEGQAEQPPVDGQPIHDEAIMNPIIPQPDQPMNPQGDAEQEGQAVAEQPPVDEQHPEAAEQPISAAEAEVEVEVEGDEPILHEPIPQGEAIINPQGSIINAEQEGQGDAEQVEAIAQQMVAIVQADVEGQEPIIPAEQPIIADVEVDVQLDIVPEPIMYPQGAIITPQGQVSAIFNGDVAQLGVIAAATIAGDVRQSTHDTRDTRKTRRQRSTPDARKTPEAITTRLPIWGEDVPFPRETITTLNRPSAVESLMTQPSQVPTIPQPTAEAMPSTDTTPQMPETQAIVTPQSSTSTTNTLTKSAKRKLKEREKAEAKAEAIALAKAEADAKKAEKGKGKSASTASRDLSLDPNNNNNQATSSTAKDPNNNNARVLNPLLISTRDLEDLKSSALQKEYDFEFAGLKHILADHIAPEHNSIHPNWRVWLLCKRYSTILDDKGKKMLILQKIKLLLGYLKLKQGMDNFGQDFFKMHPIQDLLKFMFGLKNHPDRNFIKFVNGLLKRVPKLDCISVKDLGSLIDELLISVFPKFPK